MTRSATDRYEVDLIRTKDGAPISDYACQRLRENGAHYDDTLKGFVVAGGLPMSYMAFLPMNNLTANETEVDYDVQWFQPRMERPCFDPLPSAWDGLPINDNSAYMSYFRIAGDLPFHALWIEDKGRWLKSKRTFSPTQALAEGWEFLATASESIDMMAYLVDVACGKRLRQADVENIQADLASAALEVAIFSNRTHSRSS
jgi:hypothetical protein